MAMLNTPGNQEKRIDLDPVDSTEGRERLVFASTVHPSKHSERNSLLLAESIRAFAGSLSRTPIWILYSELGEPLSREFVNGVGRLGVELVGFEVDPAIAEFPFTGEATAAALAESMAEGKVERLMWLNANTIVLNEPLNLLIPEGKSLGYRPVHHINVGSPFSEPLDPFWTEVYRLCGVPDDRVFPMRTHVDDMKIRPYFNAGYHVTKPGRGLLKAWRDVFLGIHGAPTLQGFYEADPRYRVFVHQAAFTGAILSLLPREELLELPPSHNYPIHLHDDDVTDLRPTYLEELTTVRHEGFYEDPKWYTKMPAKEPLKKWIMERLIH